MKHTITYFFLPLLLCLALCSCKQDTYEYVYFDDPDPDMFQVTRTEVDDLSEGLPSCAITDALNEAETKGVLTKGSSMTINTMAKGLITGMFGSKLHSLIGTYNSSGKDGEPLRLSGRIILPSQGEIRNIVLVSHFTITADYECPSNSFQLEGILALLGYAVVIPDYIGYGVTRDMIHPYLCADLTAKNVCDMLDAAVPYLKKIGRAPKDEGIYLMGYSQGGATTMAVERRLESEEYANLEAFTDTTGTVPLFKYKILRNFAGAGPYDIATTYDQCCEQDETSIPCAVPMIIMGMNYGEDLGLDYKNFFKEPLLSNYDEWINSKKYTTKQLGKIMGTKHVSDLMTDRAMQKRDPHTLQLYNAMMHNSIFNGAWVPYASVYMFHSIDDDTVPYVNTQMTRSKFPYCDIEYNVGHYGNHVKGCVKFIFCCVDLLK